MLSYPIPEAEELLTNKLSAAQQSLRNCEEDLDFLREQVTVRSVTRKEESPQHLSISWGFCYCFDSDG